MEPAAEAAHPRSAEESFGAGAKVLTMAGSRLALARSMRPSIWASRASEVAVGSRSGLSSPEACPDSMAVAKVAAISSNTWRTVARLGHAHRGAPALMSNHDSAVEPMVPASQSLPFTARTRSQPVPRIVSRELIRSGPVTGPAAEGVVRSLPGTHGPSHCFAFGNRARGLDRPGRDIYLYMITDSSTPSTTGHDGGPPRGSPAQTLIGRVARFEIMVGALIGALMLVLVVIEPNILEAPFENERTMLFTFGGTVLAVLAFVAMVWLGVPPVIRVIVLAVPFVMVNWWLISPYFSNDVVEESFSTSISDPASTAGVLTDEGPSTPPSGPVLLGAGEFVGLAGHSGSGDAGVFQNPDGSLVLRFENVDIENGPDLEVYLVPGPDQTSLPAGSIHLGPLKGNIGDQNYPLPAGTELAPGAYTALVWCDAFSVEFVGATIAI